MVILINGTDNIYECNSCGYQTGFCENCDIIIISFLSVIEYGDNTLRRFMCKPCFDSAKKEGPVVAELRAR